MDADVPFIGETVSNDGTDKTSDEGVKPFRRVDVPGAGWDKLGGGGSEPGDGEDGKGDEQIGVEDVPDGGWNEAGSG